MAKKSGPVCIETFCGAGGMALGLKQAGFNIVFSFDSNSAAIDTYKANLGEHGHCLDAFTVKGSDVLKKVGLKRGQVDLLSGGPPCQGFSKQRRDAHLLDDPRNKLVLEYARIVDEVFPRSFLFENVQIFGQKRGRELIDELRIKLSDYHIYSYFICSSDFGLAQTRGRFLMIGIRKDISPNIPKLKTFKKDVTIRDVIGSLPSPPLDGSEHKKILNHSRARITKLNELRFSFVPQGGGWQSIPDKYRLPCHKGVDPSQGGWPDVYGRLEWDGKCPTITGGFDNFSRGRFGHPEQNRALTLREGALLQGFPLNYKFCGTRHDIRHQIGNAVPPPVAKSAGLAILEVLSGQVAFTAEVLTPNVEQGQLLFA